MNTEGSVLNHTGDIDGHREHKKHASYDVLLPCKATDFESSGRTLPPFFQNFLALNGT